MKKIKSKCSFGFTIVEILLVTILIALLASAAGGFYARTYKKTLVKKSARDLLMAIKYAKILAVEQQTECKLKINADNNGFILTIDNGQGETQEKNELIIKDLYFKPVKFDESVKFEDIRIRSVDTEEKQKNYITFFPNGTAQEAVFQIGDGENHYSVSVSAVSGKAMIHAKSARTVDQGSTIDLDD